MILTSMQNPSIKEAARLKNRRDRDETGLFLIEGYRELLRAVEGRVKIEKVYFCPSLFLGSNEMSLLEKAEAPTIECGENVFRKLSYRDRPDGLIAVARQMKTPLTALSQTSDFLIIAEAIEKPGNLGAILRSADGAGADGVILCDRCTDIYNPNVVRSSVGTLFTQPVVESTSAETLTYLKENGYRILAATPEAKKSYTDSDLTGKIALLVGTEQLGLSDFWMEKADLKVSIPMLGTADSLNVSVAATLLMYETVRQRHDSLRR